MGGFFFNPLAVKLINVSTTQTVITAAANTTVLTQAVPLVSSVPIGKVWRIRSSAIFNPANAGGVSCNYQILIWGAAATTLILPLAENVALAGWTSGAYGAAICDIETDIINNAGTTFTAMTRAVLNLNAAAPSINDVSVVTRQTGLTFNASFPTMNVQYALSAVSAGAQITHLQTTLEQLQ